MKLLRSAAILLALMASASAFAQDATPSPTPSPSASPAAPTAPQKFYLELEQTDLNLLAQAINELPKRVADPLLLKLNGQLQAQQQIKDAADKALDEGVAKAKKRK